MDAFLLCIEEETTHLWLGSHRCVPFFFDKANRYLWKLQKNQESTFVLYFYLLIKRDDRLLGCISPLCVVCLFAGNTEISHGHFPPPRVRTLVSIIIGPVSLVCVFDPVFKLALIPIRYYSFLSAFAILILAVGRRDSVFNSVRSLLFMRDHPFTNDGRKLLRLSDVSFENCTLPGFILAVL